MSTVWIPVSETQYSMVLWRMAIARARYKTPSDHDPLSWLPPHHADWITTHNVHIDHIFMKDGHVVIEFQDADQAMSFYLAWSSHGEDWKLDQVGS